MWSGSRYSNGRREHTSDRSEQIFPSEVQGVPVCDSACQTRESLFDPPSPEGHQHLQHQVSPMPMPMPFSTFGFYDKEHEHDHSHPRKYKAEGKIRIEKVDDVPSEKRGPYSIQSTKSAPDVIVTHWLTTYDLRPTKQLHLLFTNFRLLVKKCLVFPINHKKYFICCPSVHLQL